MEGYRRGNSFQTETRTHLRMSWKSVGVAVTAFHQISIFARSQPNSRTPSPTSSILKKSSATMTRGESLNAVKRPTAKTVKRPKSMVEKSCRSKDGDGPSLVWAARCFLSLIWCSCLGMGVLSFFMQIIFLANSVFIYKQKIIILANSVIIQIQNISSTTSQN